MRKSVKLALLSALTAGAFATAVPAASAECTDLGGQGTVCTTGDPTTGSFGVRAQSNGVNLCIVVFARCP